MKINQMLKNKNKVLGLNDRYLNYIRPYNLKRATKIADDKILTKIVLQRHNIPVPEKLATISNRVELDRFSFDSLPKSFVIKPTNGSKGGGIEIIYNKDKNGNFIKSGGDRVSEGYLRSLCRDIIDGRFSLFNEPDVVLIEERIRPFKAFRYYTYRGTPDIRIFVYNKIPIMGMIRFPTRESEGKGNLDKGAIGCGIDMAAGKTTYALIGKSTPIEYVPDTKIPLSGVRIPYWNRMLKYSIEASKVTKLGFASVDFLIDKEKGPVITELNARSGLSIQIANQDGLKWRLEKAGGLKVKSVDHGIRLAKNLFGGEIEESIEALSGKQVIGLIEPITIFGKNGKSEKVKAKIDTGATISSIDRNLAYDLGYKSAIEYAAEILKDIPSKFETKEEAKQYSIEYNLNQRLEEHEDIIGTAIIASSNGTTYRITVKMEVKIADLTLELAFNIANRSDLLYPVLIGKRDLKKFLIDPNKNTLLK